MSQYLDASLMVPGDWCRATGIEQQVAAKWVAAKDGCLSISMRTGTVRQ